MANLNYFVCSLGQAKRHPHRGSFRNISGFLSQQASRVPDQPAVGFYVPETEPSQSWDHHVLTFKEVQQGCLVVAEMIAGAVLCPQGQTVALLCPSNADFLFTWLGLMHLSQPVLLLAPQCAPLAIANLCTVCNISNLFYDESYEALAREASNAKLKGDGVELHLQRLQSIIGTSVVGLVSQQPLNEVFDCSSSETDVAYLHHTSGTSMGVPKAIPQTHRAGIGVLPQLSGSAEGSFSTTPLYHGGIADLFRAWSSDAMIWLFPGKEIPITATNITRCLSISRESSNTNCSPPIKYFSSVPYVLQMMAADKKGLEYLKAMDVVGVGGAALATKFGNELEKQSINLTSRFGSAECGFLLSSHREYDQDHEWEYLRADPKVEAITFELREEGLSELVVLDSWPHMAKTNRRDGSYATADLFEPHPTLPNAWRYHSRADSQLTLVTGKKLDPAPLESAILTSTLLDDVFIFGNGRPYPGAIVFRSEMASELSDQQLIEAIAPAIEKINFECQAHSRIPKNMLLPMPYSEHNLEKSSKGTIIRKRAQERYSLQIDRAYSQAGVGSMQDVPDNEVLPTVMKIVKSVVGKSGGLTGQTDLFSFGADSVACVQIRHALINLLPPEAQDLPLTVVEDSGTSERLATLVVNRRRGIGQDYDNDKLKRMVDLAHEHSQFLSGYSQDNEALPTGKPFENEVSTGEVVLLTGATGLLGAHVLHQYLRSPACSKIYCLVRGLDDQAAYERIAKALSSRKLSPVSSDTSSSKVSILRFILSDPHLGLPQSTYAHLTTTVTIIHHLAWDVNFRINLSSFVGTHVVGLCNLIKLALASPQGRPIPRFLFCSSVASVSNYPKTTCNDIPECISSDPVHAGPLGYSRSKWIAEAICYAAHQNTKLRNRIAIMRVGQLSGNSETGVWNMSEAYPMMLASMSLTNSLPDLKDEYLQWLPVDLAAKAFVETAQNMTKDRVTDYESSSVSKGDEIRLYHIVNPGRTAQWQDLLQWLKGSGEDFRTVEPGVWVQMFEDLEKRGVPHPAMRLLPHWKRAYCLDPTSKNVAGEEENVSSKKKFVTEETFRIAPALTSVQPVNSEYFLKIWRWIQEYTADQGEHLNAS